MQTVIMEFKRFNGEPMEDFKRGILNELRGFGDIPSKELEAALDDIPNDRCIDSINLKLKPKS